MVNKNTRQLNKLLILTTEIARIHNWNLHVQEERNLVKEELRRLGPIILFPSCKISGIPRKLQLVINEWVESEKDIVHLPINSDECMYMLEKCKGFYKRDWNLSSSFVKEEGSDFVWKYSNTNDDFINLYMLGAEIELTDIKLLYESLVFGGLIPFDLSKKYEVDIMLWAISDGEDILSKVSEKALYEFDNLVTQFLVSKNPDLYALGNEIYNEIFRTVCPEMSDEEIPKVSEEIEIYDWDELLKIASEEESTEWVKDYVFDMSYLIANALIQTELSKNIYQN